MPECKSSEHLCFFIAISDFMRLYAWKCLIMKRDPD